MKPLKTLQIYNQQMQPLIKWPGGKTKEFAYIEKMIPSFKRYIEPFFGGGGVYFNLAPKNAVINDIVPELMGFYLYAKGEDDYEEFKSELYELVENWEKVPKYIKLFKKKFNNLYSRHAKTKIPTAELTKIVYSYLNNEVANFNGLFHEQFCVDRNNFSKQLNRNLVSKINRTLVVANKIGSISAEDLEKNIETAFRSGFYMHFRDLLNKAHDYKLYNPKKIAIYYFIREFCYASMFRFNSKGEFNIPYGGIAYNSKNFRKKVDYIFSSEIRGLLNGAQIYTGDFEKLLKSIKFTKEDFIFLDPPYDTEFSDYENNIFDRRDQIRLAKFLYKTPAKFILIIKNTPFILGLYKNRSNLKIKSFDKTYLYNIKGRNDRNVEHLIVYNF